MRTGAQRAATRDEGSRSTATWRARLGASDGRAAHLERAPAAARGDRAWPVGESAWACQARIGEPPAGAAAVDLQTFEPPDSSFAREAEQACAEQPAAIVGHSYRTWLFGQRSRAVDGSAAGSRALLSRCAPPRYGIVPADCRERLHPGKRRPHARVRRRRWGRPATAPSSSRTRSASTRRPACRRTATARSVATCSGARWSMAPGSHVGRGSRERRRDRAAVSAGRLQATSSSS